MARQIRVPIKTFGNRDWGDLNALHLTHEIVGETVKQAPDMSFQGGHRVRVFRFKKNVHWLIPEGIELDISEVGTAARKRQE